MGLWERFVLLFLLGWNTFTDMRSRRIEGKSVLIGGTAGLLWCLAHGLPGLRQAVLGMLPGALLLLIGKLGKEAVGYGDGLIVAVIGIYAGLWDTFGLLLGALTAAAVTGSLLLICGRGTVKTELPFVPFLLAAYVGGTFIGKI